MINRKRLADTFVSLVKIDSESKNEKAVCAFLADLFQNMGGDPEVDDAAAGIGGNSGNLVVRFAGAPGIEPLLLSAHMDTVAPGQGIDPVLTDGVFSSRGDTILGADDKSALAIIAEALRVTSDQGGPVCPIDLVITVCEEIGLVGAKHLDTKLFSAKNGYVLDASDTAGIVTRAPAANKFSFVVQGKDAHAGAHPEDGVNAIAVAAQALAKLSPGRVDDETTFNIGLIQGGIATNIVPPVVTIKGEARSHSDQKLADLTDHIVSVFKETAEEQAATSSYPGLPFVEIEVENDFKSLLIGSDHKVVRTAMTAASRIGVDLKEKTSGGGSDANIFFQQGITAAILGTGMKDMHTVRETVAVDDLVRAAELLVEIIRQWSAQ